MEGLIASSPVPPVLIIVGVLLAVLVVFVAYPYVNRNRFTETFGLRPDTKSPVVADLIRWKVGQYTAALDAKIAEIDAQTRQAADEFKRAHQALGVAGGIGTVKWLEKQREMLHQELKSATRLAQVNGASVAAGPPPSVQSQNTNGKVEKATGLVTAGNKSP